MVLNRKQVIWALKNKLRCIENSGSHIRYIYQINGKDAVMTRVSHPHTKRDDVIDDSLANLMARQMELKLREFKDLVNCPMTKEEYDNILISKFPDLEDC